ncbi:MAG: prepilin peptidase [Planctomycetes bacterium]|nr:prepilin peptidase [Planctomycetota bacterium]
MSEVFEIIGMMPPWFWLAWAFLVGSFVGSFLNVVVYRLPRNCLSINKPKRSFCPSCKTQLKWNDNLPIIGWIWLRGKCRYCGVKFGMRYPAVELLTAGLFALTMSRVLFSEGNISDQPLAWLTVLHIFLIISVLLPWALIDLDLQTIPDKLTLGPLIVFIPFAADVSALDFGTTTGHQHAHLLFGWSTVWLDSMVSALAAGFGAAFALWFIGKISNVVFAKRAAEMGGETMGFGDVKLMLLLGVMLGAPKLVAAFFIAIFVGAIFGSIQLLLKKGHFTPFGPYLTLGAVTAAIGMDQILWLWDKYMAFLQSAA